MTPHFDSFDAFWPYYLKEHDKPLTRIFHFVGTALIVPCLLFGALLDWHYFLLAPLCGYGFAWVSHAFIEKNRPATFSYPWWSLLADLKMFLLMLTGRPLV